MTHKSSFALTVALVSMLFAIACQPSEQVGTPLRAKPTTETPQLTQSASDVASDEEFNGEKIVKTDKEWRASLSPAEFNVLREEGTERAYSGELLKNKEAGSYHCAACGLKLYSSETKYESNTGWPSFYQPINAKNVTEKADNSHGATRTEIECARCGSHLGHVFDDGPQPTGLRYCMNSLALKFEKAN